MEGDADFEVALEAADAGAMACARINDDDRRLCRVDAVVPALVASLRDAQQGTALAGCGNWRASRIISDLKSAAQAGRLARCSSMALARFRNVSKNRIDRSRTSR